MRRSPRLGWLHPSLRRAFGVALVALLVPAAAFAIAGNGKLQIHHMDIGQGDAALLISPNGQTALFDDGNYLSCTNIKSYLQGLGLTTVDYHFLSHYHSDHLGCIDDLAAIGIVIGTAGYDRGYSYSSGTYTSYVNTLGAKRHTIAKNQTITLDTGSAHPVSIKCVDLNGAGVYSPSGSDENAKSAVYEVTYGNFNEVIGGDLTGDPASSNDVETTVGPETGDVEVYKVHHHGSQYSSNDNWLNAVTPEVGIISCGDGNSYGHPTTAALTRLHNHGVHTYWTETGNGATPNPTWDKVGGTIVIQAQWAAGATYTVAGSGFTDTYTNDGSAPPINITQVAASATVLKGSISTGDYTRLAISDDVKMSVSAGVTGGNYYTDWYGSVFLSHPPLDLKVTYEGNFTISRTQTLYLWNWSTSAWDQFNTATVSTTDVTANYSPASFGNYVGPSREVRLRVKGDDRAGGSYTSRGDYLAVNYDYTSGTSPMLASSGQAGTLAAVAAPAAIASVASATPLLLASREALTDAMPTSVLRRIDGSPTRDGVQLTWTVGSGDHIDGFNVYRESGDRGLVFAGNDATITGRGDEAIFRFVDPGATAGGTYWLGARACSGPETMIGPIRVEGASALVTGLTLTMAPNPAFEVTRFGFTLERAGAVTLEIFDLQGRRIATPFRGHSAAGTVDVDWSLRDDQGRPVEAGLYFARLETEGRTLYTRVNIAAR